MIHQLRLGVSHTILVSSVKQILIAEIAKMGFCFNNAEERQKRFCLIFPSPSCREENFGVDSVLFKQAYTHNYFVRYVRKIFCFIQTHRGLLGRIIFTYQQAWILHIYLHKRMRAQTIQFLFSRRVFSLFL